jgi:hypothetical protein
MFGHLAEVALPLTTRTLLLRLIAKTLCMEGSGTVVTTNEATMFLANAAFICIAIKKTFVYFFLGFLLFSLSNLRSCLNNWTS